MGRNLKDMCGVIMKRYNEEELNNTLAALMVFSDEFSSIMQNIGLGVTYYKIVIMLTEMKKKTTDKKDMAKINEYIEFYREKLFILIGLLKENFFELGEEDEIFNMNIVRKSSKVVGDICDELLNVHGYGDVADLSKKSDGVDLSDFYIPFDDDEDIDDEADY